MLKSSLPLFVIAAALGGGMWAQAQSTTPSASNKDKPAPVTLNGCVTTSAPGTFVVQDEKKGRFELTGQKLDLYIGKRVEVQGSSESEKGLHITTGLYPSPNAAAQAGAIDPVRAAQGAMPGSPDRVNPNTPLPKITVTQVKAVNGACK